MYTDNDNNIHFQYFYEMFINDCNEQIIKLDNSEKNDEDMEYIFKILGVYNNNISSEKKIEIYKKVLFEVCLTYLSLSNSDIIIIEKDPFNLIKAILEENKNNKYKNSFLTSLQFIYQEFLCVLDKGSPILMSSNDIKKDSYLEIVLDSHFKILDFNSINMNLLEQASKMNEIVSMECRKTLGPIKNVRIRVRHDI